MSEVKTRKVRKTTNLGKILKKMEKIGGMVPAMPIAALPLSRMLATPQQTIPNRPDAPKEDYRAYLGIYGLSLVVLLSDAYGPKKAQLFRYSKSLNPLEELALWTTAFSVLRTEGPEFYQTFSGTSFDQAYGRQG